MRACTHRWGQSPGVPTTLVTAATPPPPAHAHVQGTLTRPRVISRTPRVHMAERVQGTQLTGHTHRHSPTCRARACMQHTTHSARV